MYFHELLHFPDVLLHRDVPDLVPRRLFLEVDSSWKGPQGQLLLSGMSSKTRHHSTRRRHVDSAGTRMYLGEVLLARQRRFFHAQVGQHSRTPEACAIDLLVCPEVILEAYHLSHWHFQGHCFQRVPVDPIHHHEVHVETSRWGTSRRRPH